MNEKKQSILIVDDIEMNRYILKQHFSAEFNVLEAVNGIDALDCIGKNLNNIAVIILDLQMPIADGYYVLQKMNENKWQVPVIVSTALDGIDSEIKAIEMGALDYVTKPILPKVLQIRVNSALAKRRAVLLEMENQRLLTLKEEEERYQKELKYTLTHDELTGLLSKQGFILEAAKFIQTNSTKQCSIIRIGIRQFKVLNELFGFSKGDEVLKKMARALVSRGEGIYSRWEADIFYICRICDDINQDDIVLLENELRSLVSDYAVEVTVGIYNIENATMDIPSMCDRAMLAEKEIKRKPLLKIGVYNKELNERLLAESRVLSEFDTALANNEFVIYLQPIVSLSHRGIVGAEALVRWKHPERGLISPGMFINVLEKNGRIADLDYRVWELTCKHLRDRLDRGEREIPISVNLSRIHLANPNLASMLDALMEKYTLPHHLLRLEITETAYVSNKLLLLKTLSQLQNSGFKILMDDFGSGYSSVNMLKDMPVDILKIDMGLMENVTTSPKAGAIVSSIINMAQLLSMAVVAEGVETAQQVAFLRSVGCDRIQGYYYSPPLPLDEFEVASTSKRFYVGKEVEQKPTLDNVSELFSASTAVSKLLDNIYGAIGFYLYKGGKLNAMRVNNKYYDIMGYNVDTYLADSSDMLTKVYHEDLGSLTQALEQVSATGKPERRLFRRYNTMGKVMYLDAIISYVGATPDPVLSIAFSEVTAYITAHMGLDISKIIPKKND